MTITVFGAKGRMGKKVVEIAKSRNYIVTEIDKDDKCNSTSDVCIDFSTASATNDVCNYCKTFGVPLVTGVTGRSIEQKQMVEDLGFYVDVTQKENFAEFFTDLEIFCKYLAEKYKTADVEIVETHHSKKLDAPSGSAKKLASIIAKERNFKRTIIHSQRLGNTCGSHTVTFALGSETLTLTHTALDTTCFAVGAVDEAEKILNNKRKILQS